MKIISLLSPARYDKIRGALFDFAHERVAFLVGTRRDGAIVVSDIWPTRNETRRDPRYAYAITARAWREARERARALGLLIVGHAHSHPNGGIGPSPRDLWYIRRGEVGLVYHPKGFLAWYTRDGLVRVEKMRQSIFWRAVGLLFTAE